MALIPRLTKTEKEAFTVRLSRATAEELKRYCQFIDSPQDYVIGQALEMVFRKDKEYAEWRTKEGEETPPKGTGKAERSRITAASEV